MTDQEAQTTTDEKARNQQKNLDRADVSPNIGVETSVQASVEFVGTFFRFRAGANALRKIKAKDAGERNDAIRERIKPRADCHVIPEGAYEAESDAILARVLAYDIPDPDRVASRL